MLHGQIGIPIRIKDRLHSLLLVDSVSSRVEEKVALLGLAGRCGGHIETILDVETSVDVSNRSTQLRTWLADSLPLIRKLRGSTRIASILKFAAELLGGEVAVWNGAEDEEPLAGPPVAAHGFDLLSRTWKSIPELTDWIRNNESGGWRSNLVEASGGPKVETRYIGARESRSGGILIVLFSPGAETPEDPESLVDLLSVLCREIEPASESGQLEPASPDEVVGVDSFRLHIEREWNRSLRFGHFFSVTRFEPVSDGDVETLREFLTEQKRVVDIMAAGKNGLFYFLTPETENDPEGIKIRLSAQWLEQHPATPIKIDQMIFPVDGEHCDGYLDWVQGNSRAA